MLHPFSGNSKATQSPPSYQKGFSQLSSSPPSSPPFVPYHWKGVNAVDDDEEMDEDVPVELALPDGMDEDESGDQFWTDGESTVIAAADGEERVWDVATSTAFDKRERKIDLSNRNLTFIPPTIRDFSYMTVLSTFSTDGETKKPFIKTPSAPSAVFQFSGRSFQRATTTSALALNSGNDHERSDDQSLHLYLANNRIERIPVELCGIERLTVLSLRGNLLRSLPDCIGLLTNLRELNVSNNALTYLPSSLLALSLDTVNLHPNPFIPPPANLAPNKLGPLISHPFPKLRELIIRYLVSPRGGHRPIQEFQLPLEDPVRPGLRVPLHLSLAPRLHYHGPDDDAELKPMRCPNPAHARDEEGEVWFTEPAEERMQWRTEIGGANVSAGGDGVPFLWKGCSSGCLAFLEEIQA